MTWQDALNLGLEITNGADGYPAVTNMYRNGVVFNPQVRLAFQNRRAGASKI